jgi:hypothetical protein
VAAVPSGPNWTPPPTIGIKKKLIPARGSRLAETDKILLSVYQIELWLGSHGHEQLNAL